MFNKKNKKSEVISNEDYVSQLSGSIVTEIFRIINKEIEDLGPSVGESVQFTVLGSLLSTILYKDLTANALAKTTEDQKFKRYKDLKNVIQNTISMGFETAFSKFTGKQVDYVTTVDPMPEPLNKEPC